MQFKQLLADEDAVSPVIGVILMVAITVILAAVIGTFVLGLGDQVQDNAPQASFTFDYDDGVTSGDDCWTTGYASGGPHPLEVTHDGGDKVEAADLDMIGGTTQQTVGDGACLGTDSDVTAGTGWEYAANSDDTVRVVWKSGGANSATLGKWTGPDA